MFGLEPVLLRTCSFGTGSFKDNLAVYLAALISPTNSGAGLFGLDFNSG